MPKKIFAFFVVAILSIPNITIADLDQKDSFHRFWPDNLFAVEFLNDQVGFIAGYSGTILKTIDGGGIWNAHYIGRNELIRNISFVSHDVGWAVGHRGSIFRTSNGGNNWEVQKEIKDTYLRDVDFIDEMHGWVVGHGENIWHTRDGGENWTREKITGLYLRDPPRLHAVKAITRDVAVLAGEFGVVAYTEDSGKTWIPLPIDKKVTWLSLSGNEQGIYATGLDGSIARLTVASESELVIIKEKILSEREKIDKKEKKKAKRKKRPYIQKEYYDISKLVNPYKVVILDSNTDEHLFSSSSTADNDVVVVGRSSVLFVSGTQVTAMKPEENFPLPFIWLGGVDVTPSGKFWSAGIRGLVVSGDIHNGGNYQEEFQLANSDRVKLVSNRWSDK